jgi:shikimate dehydrogenase
MTDRYAVFGNPVRHSKSPLVHTTFARETGQDLTYEAIEAPVDDFEGTLAGFRQEGGRGINVTTPFKLRAFALATHPTERAKLAGACNCMKFDGERAYAENYDGVGLVNDIQRNLGFDLRGLRVLMLGAGGAARGALQPMLEQKPALLYVANRDVAKATALRGHFAHVGDFTAGPYGDLEREASFDVVINATSASLNGELPPVPGAVFGAKTLAYEMVYGRGLTPFLRVAHERGVKRVADGVGMLVEQAAEAFLWWRGVRPETRTLIRQLTVPLA